MFTFSWLVMMNVIISLVLLHFSPLKTREVVIVCIVLTMCLWCVCVAGYTSCIDDVLLYDACILF